MCPAIVIDADTPWIVAANQPEPIQRALQDVERDWYKVFGRRPMVLRQRPESSSGPVLLLGQGASWRRQTDQDVPVGAESFLVATRQDASGQPVLVASGNDIRGCIYAAYAFSEEVLGVDPWYYWVDKEPMARERVDIPAGFEHRDGSPTFRYRGWFINDEDLLSGFSPDPLRENAFSLEMSDRIYETLLRLRGNMVAPATFPFADERCQELASRRGLILNMHHCLVLGLNMYRWPADVPFSYNRHPEILERFWQASIDAYKDREVVWSVAYRGKSDHPFWVDDPELETHAARGQLITKAIAKQVELVRKLDPDAPIIANMWSEGADLFHQGLIQLPDGVTLVWPDAGNGIIRDQGRVQAGQGIYYHTAMMSGAHNQLTEMVNPGRISEQIGRFVRAGATDFLLVNVSDVRPVPLSTDCVMRWGWNADPYLGQTDEVNMDRMLVEWSRRQFGDGIGPEVAGIYRDYFTMPYMDGSSRKGEHWIHRCLRRLVTKVHPLISAGKPLDPEVLGMAAEWLPFSSENRKAVQLLWGKAEALTSRIPADRRDFYQSHVLVQIQIHLQSLASLQAACKAALAYQEEERPVAIEHASEALAACDRLQTAMRKAEYGKWAAWYAGERFIDLQRTRLVLLDLLAALQGEKESIKPDLWEECGRDPVHHYNHIYQYQKPFLENFPRFYPAKPQLER
jgi:hypothetical protein